MFQVPSLALMRKYCIGTTKEVVSMTAARINPCTDVQGPQRDDLWNVVYVAGKSSFSGNKKASDFSEALRLSNCKCCIQMNPFGLLMRVAVMGE